MGNADQAPDIGPRLQGDDLFGLLTAGSANCGTLGDQRLAIKGSRRKISARDRKRPPTRKCAAAGRRTVCLLHEVVGNPMFRSVSVLFPLVQQLLRKTDRVAH